MLNLTCGLLPLAYLPGLVSAGTVPRWALLSVMVPLMLWRVDVGKVPIKWVLLAALSYAAASLIWMEVRIDGYMELWHSALLVGIFAIGASAESIEEPVRLMAISLAASLPLVAFQALGYTGIDQMVSPAGLFINKNMLSEAAAALLVAMVFTRQWAISAALLAIVALTFERASVAALGIVFMFWLWPKSKRFAIVLFILGAGALSMMAYSPSAIQRFAIWMDAIQGFTVFGQGIGSFWTAFPIKATNYDLLQFREDYAHNEAINYVFELGIGAALLGGVAIRALVGRKEMERFVFIAILVESCFSFPLHMPVTGFLAALVAGNLCRGLHEPSRAGIGLGECHA